MRIHHGDTEGTEKILATDESWTGTDTFYLSQFNVRTENFQYENDIQENRRHDKPKRANLQENETCQQDKPHKHEGTCFSGVEVAVEEAPHEE
jgi:hypothetical protein